MSNETKRDVFNDLVEKHQNYINTVIGDYGCKDKAVEGWNERYTAALPDDLPVIPELIGEYLKMWKHDHGDLFQAFDEGTSTSLDGTKWESVQDWFSYVKDSFDTFASAWLAEMWIVEETGEIVKLEAQHD